jgi:hypothetical protein
MFMMKVPFDESSQSSMAESFKSSQKKRNSDDCQQKIFSSLLTISSVEKKNFEVFFFCKREEKIPLINLEKPIFKSAKNILQTFLNWKGVTRNKHQL